ncbi:hypothetical protein KIN20_032131 [Parelaphostrongylus tenuis]|uniref:Uncharacterized protein n=1 Tax=Parelaphostrongylus tenuis TaxID=148309 RepID=A0AAD5WHU7_PARTN|nr:hypothetical protein KIN20_032131 [Parelaphostrongylus tenuis]
MSELRRKEQRIIIAGHVFLMRECRFIVETWSFQAFFSRIHTSVNKNGRILRKAALVCTLALIISCQ